MRGFRIIHHTEKVGEAMGSGMPVSRRGTPLGPQRGRDSGEFLLRHRIGDAVPGGVRHRRVARRGPTVRREQLG
jgi:hypothetical protein